MLHTRTAALALWLVLALALPARAQTEIEAQFDVYFSGIRAGLLVFKGLTTDTQYSAAGRLQSTGLLRIVADIRYDASVVGRIRDGRFVPVRYEEVANTGQRVSEAVMEYVDGVPQVKAFAPPRDPKPDDLHPATQGGTLDPASAVFFLLRDVPEAQMCPGAIAMFDGVRRSRLSVENPQRDGDTVTCSGQYRREAGFADWEMAQKSDFPFTVIYRQGEAGLMTVDQVRIDTLYGTAVLDRR
jgi:hypothetical protein